MQISLRNFIILVTELLLDYLIIIYITVNEAVKNFHDIVLRNGGSFKMYNKKI